MNKIGVAFGSYGWSGEAVKLINQEFEAMKFDILDPGLKIPFVPDQTGIDASYELGKRIGQAIND